MRIVDAVFVSKEPVGRDAYEITLRTSVPLPVHPPGKYIWVVLPELVEPDKRGNRRAFSLSSPIASNGDIKIMFRASSSGYKLTLLSLKPEAHVQIITPAGSSFVPSNEMKHIVMIASGVGVAPFVGILRSIGDARYAPYLASLKYSLIYVNKSPDRAVLTEEINTLAKTHGVNFILAEGDFSADLLPQSVDTSTATFFVCGSQHLIEQVNTILGQLGVPTDNVRYEENYPIPQNNLTEADFTPHPKQKNIMLQAVLESKNHVVITDANGRIVFANKQAERNTGYSFEEMRGNTPRLWGGVMPTEFYHSFWKQKKQPTGFDGEMINRRKNGDTYHVITHISPIYDDKSTIIGYIGTEEDISERAKLERQLKIQNENLARQQERDNAILRSIGDGVVAVDDSGRVILVNDSAAAILGIPKDQMTGKKYVDIVPAEEEDGTPIPSMNRSVVQAMKKNKTITTTMSYIRPDGTKFLVAVINTPLIVDNKTYGSVIAFRDVTAEHEIDRAKTEFISLASHQLRTPLSTINWYVEMLLSGDAGKITDEQRKFLEEAYMGSQRMVELVNALLNVSRIESNTYMVQPEPVDVIALIKSVLSELRPKIEQKHLSVTLDNDKIPIISLDPNLMSIIVQNLASNAIKYTPIDGIVTITVRLQPEVNNILIKVHDTGMGIPKTQQSKIFTKLFRADNARKADTEGTGLGLYLIRGLIERAGGAIWFESEESKGSSFYVTIPLAGMEPKKGTKKIDGL